MSSLKRRLEDMKELSIATFNVHHWTSYEALKLERLPDGSPRFLQNPYNPREDKPMHKRIGIAKKILEMNADIVVLQEIIGSAVHPMEPVKDAYKALLQLSNDFLGSIYVPHVLPSNDPGGLHVAFLVKKDLPFEFDKRSYRDRKWVDPVNNSKSSETRVFTRDLPALFVKNEKGEVKLIQLAAHFKSKNSRLGDEGSRLLAKAQIDESARIIKELKAEFPNAEIVLSGDFNGQAHIEPEFEALREILKDATSLDKDIENPMLEASHSYFSTAKSPGEYERLDQHWVSGGLAKFIIDAATQDYLNREGSKISQPQSFRQRNAQQPSDHKPVLLRLNADFLRN